jgi:hypothetical protein
LRASWLLFKESWRFLAADKEMLFIPLIATVLNIFLFGILITIGAMVSTGMGGDQLFTGDSLSRVDYVFVFAFYVVGAFTLAISQAGIIHTVYTRAHGGNATLGQSLSAAFSHSGSLFVWSLITSTVGLFLRVVSDRSELIGKIVAAVAGAAWAIATFFVVPAMVIDKKSAFASIPHSLTVFKQTWGETIVSNFSLGLFFFMAHMLALLSFVGLIIAGVSIKSLPLILLACVLIVLWLVVTALIQAALQGVIKTLLYMYATENTIPSNFNAELLQAMMTRRGVAPVAPVSVSEQQQQQQQPLAAADAPYQTVVDTTR